MAEREMSADVAEAAEQTLAAEEGSAAPRGIKAKWRSLPEKKRKGIAVAVIVPLALLLLYALYNLAVLAAAVASTGKEDEIWLAWQRDHIAALAASYESGEAPVLDESSFCNFDLDAALDEGMKLNELRYLATHNSYKQGVSRETGLFYDSAAFGAISGKYDYVFDDLTTQLNNGIRSIEIDFFKNPTEDGFTIRILHNAMFEHASSMLDLELALTEMKMWSDYNPGHLPVIVLVEPKTSGGQGLKPMDTEAHVYAGELLEKVLGDKLYTPEDMLGGYRDFAALRAANGYPEAEDVLGKFIFLHHCTGKDDKEFFAIDPALKKQKMFYITSVPGEKADAAERERMDDVAFLLANNLTDEDLECMAEGNFIVRTRIDKFHDIDPDHLAWAIASSANIMSTDYPPTPSGRYDYTARINEAGKPIDRVVR